MASRRITIRLSVIVEHDVSEPWLPLLRIILQWVAEKLGEE
jgi:hypothetical protein